MIERKPDGGLSERIEFLEMIGAPEDAELLCLLIELRRHRENKPAPAVLPVIDPAKIAVLPDHKYRECVNGLLEEAIAYAGTQQLRSRISSRLSNFVMSARAAGLEAKF